VERAAKLAGAVRVKIASLSQGFLHHVMKAFNCGLYFSIRARHASVRLVGVTGALAMRAEASVRVSR